ncbi:MAG TPA: hypothetical protein VK083_07165 [Nocardia sp.]|uniref:hypothetical protein n=1 Tax=Nocardia TaxID=1817 RepID=UPI00245535C6|nr:MULTISPECIES: hypothetical protein [Nocardia]HLS76551.1 hypothetical protein [Nocardia sp.]
MAYLLALIAIIVVAVLMYKAFGPGRIDQPTAPPRRRPILGPDDDPEFLWRISREQQRRDGEGPKDL